MSVDAAAMDRLARRLLADRAGRLSAVELDAVLSWLGGGERHGAGRLSIALGRPQTRPHRVSQLYTLLDRQFFPRGRLDLQAAHLVGSGSRAEQKARFRRLIQAFHPDRYPEMADWLTPRSQALHKAYVAFKRGETLVQTVPVPKPSPARPKPDADPDHPWQPGPFRRSARLVPERSGWLRRLFTWGRRTQRLSTMLVAGLALVVLLPLLALHLASSRQENAGESMTGAASARLPTADRPMQSGPHTARPDPQPAAAAQHSSPGGPAQADARPASAPAAVSWETPPAGQIEALLQRFSRYVNRGDLDGLRGLLAESPRSDHGAGAGGLSAHYEQVFDRSRRRYQEFQVLDIEPRPPYWSVHTLSRLTMAFDDLTARHEETRYRLAIRRLDDGELRIVGLDD